jgi:hypothetical protein
VPVASRPRSAAELGFRGNEGRIRVLDPALTRPIEVKKTANIDFNELGAGGIGVVRPIFAFAAG